jgi:hypothetical protein
MRDEAWKVIRLRKTVALIASLLWLGSLALPALTMRPSVEQSYAPLYGYGVLASGYFYIFAGQFGWLANWVLLLMLIGMSFDALSDRALRWWGIALALLSLDTLDLVVRADYYGHPGLLPGYYVWMAANLGAAIVALVPKPPSAPDP